MKLLKITGTLLLTGLLLCFTAVNAMAEATPDNLIDYADRFVAHRGVSRLAPENTLKSFSLAASYGIPSVETDIRRTKDGTFILLHDDTFLHMCNVDLAPEEMTYKDVSDLRIITGNNYDKYNPRTTTALRIPSLKEYLRLCSEKNLTPFMEIKLTWPEEVTGTARSCLMQSQLRQIYEEVRFQYGEEPFVFLSQDYDTLLEMKKVLTGENALGQVTLLHIVVEDSIASGEITSDQLDTENETLDNTPNNMHTIEEYTRAGIGLCITHRLAAPDAVRTWTAMGLVVDVWTINNAEDAADYINAGASYITTNTRFWTKEEAESMMETVEQTDSETE